MKKIYYDYKTVFFLYTSIDLVLLISYCLDKLFFWWSSRVGLALNFWSVLKIGCYILSIGLSTFKHARVWDETV